MPSRSFASALPSGAVGCSAPSSGGSPWRRKAGGGSEPCFSNKLVRLSPDPKGGPFFFLFPFSYRGGRGCGRSKRSSSSLQLGCDSPTSTTRIGLLPALKFSSVYPMAEGRPIGALLLLLFLPACLPNGRQCILGLESIFPSSDARRSGGVPVSPSGFVPGGVRRVSEQRLFQGPNCNLRSRVRVLLACFRDRFVTFSFLESFVELCTSTALK